MPVIDKAGSLALKVWNRGRESARRHPRTWIGGASFAVLFSVLLAGMVHDPGKIIKVKRGDLSMTVAVTGTLKAVNTKLFGPPSLPHIWNYSIARMVPEGTVVKKGQMVLAFDSSDLVKELKEKSAESSEAAKQIDKKKAELLIQKEDNRLKLAQAEGALQKIEMQLDVPPDLQSVNDRKKIKLDLRSSETEVAKLQTSLKESIEAAQSELVSLMETKKRADDRVNEIKRSIKRMKVVAPNAGTVIYETNWQGDKKAVGDRCWVGEKILEVADLNKMKAEGEVDEVDSGKVKPGQRVTLRLDAAPEITYSGHIESVWGALQPKSNTNPLKIIKLDIALDRTDTRHMMPGMRFSGTIETRIVKDAIIIPASAVRTGASGPVVIKKTILGWHKTRIETGKRSRDEVQVLSGLSKGDKILNADEGEATS